jgi:hypothetical protein
MPQTAAEALKVMSEKQPDFIKNQMAKEKNPNTEFQKLIKMNKHLYPDDNRIPFTDPLFREHQIRKFGKTIVARNKRDLDSATNDSEREVVNSRRENESMLRDVYKSVDKDIPGHIQSMEKDGSSTSDMATAAFNARQSSRIATRKLMADPAAVAFLEHAEQIGFGNPNGETLQQHIERGTLTHGSKEVALKEIIGSSSRTNKSVDQALKPKQDNAPKQAGENNGVLSKDFKKYYPELYGEIYK